MGREQSVKYYNDIYAEDSHYHDSYLDLPYFPVLETVVDYLKTTTNNKILEVGCGTGQLAHYLHDLGYRDYRGFDFSPVAINKAKNLSPQNFYVGDALNPESYMQDYNIVIAIEILEHMNDDIAVINLIKKGCEVILSFPTFNDKAHVRYFKKPQEIINRYGEYINFNHISNPYSWFVARGVIK